MIKSINISTKITLLILLLSLVAVTAVSFFTYDSIRKAHEEKYLTNLNVIADNRAAFVSTYLDKVLTRLDALKQSEMLRTGGSASPVVADSGGDLMAMMAPAEEEQPTDAGQSTASANPL